MKNKKAYWRLSQLRHMDLRICPCFWTFPLSLPRILCLNQVLVDEPSWNTGEGVLMRDVLWLYLHCWKPSETSEMGASGAMEMLLTCRRSPICRGRWGWTVNPPGRAQGVISLFTFEAESLKGSVVEQKVMPESNFQLHCFLCVRSGQLVNQTEPQFPHL